MSGKQIRLVKNTLILFVGVIGTKLINFVMLPFYTSWLSVEEYGMIDIFTVLITIIAPICTLQIDQAVFRFMIDDVEESKKKNTVSSGIAIVLIVLLVLNAVSTVVLLGLSYTYFLLYLFAISIQCVYTLLQQIARGEGLNEVYSANSILLAFVNVVLAILFIRFWRMGVTGYILAFCISHFVASAVLIIRINVWNLFSMASATLVKAKELFRYSVPLIVNNVSWWILNASDKLVLNIFCGINANGIYASAGKIPGFITTIYTVFHLAWQESTSREKQGDISKYYSEVFRKMFAVLSYMCIFLLCTLRLSFRILINSKFDMAYTHIPILLIALFFYCIAQYYGGIYIGKKEAKMLGYTSAIAAGINLIVNLVFVNGIQIYAASVSTLVSYAFLAFVRFVHVKKLCKINYNYKEIGMIFAFMTAAMVFSYTRLVYLSLAFLAIITVFYFIIYKYVVVEILTVFKQKYKNKR